MGTKHRGPPEERRALDAYVKFVRAYDTIASRLRSALREEGLTVTQLGVLEALLHGGAMVQSTLAEKLLTSASNLTTVLDNLERDGHVRRERSTEDRRQVEVSLTPQGRDRIEDVFPRHARRITRLFAALEPEEQDRFAELCRKLGRAAERAG